MILINYKVKNRDAAVKKLDRHHINQATTVNRHHQERDRQVSCDMTH